MSEAHVKQPRSTPVNIARPGLLVSVRSAAEAKIALRAGVDLIDVKEPRAGSLGRASDQAMGEIAAVIGGRCPLSFALGELVDEPRLPGDWPRSQACYAKIGLAGCMAAPDWQSRWRAAVADWPESVRRVAVVYADHAAAEAPRPEAVLELATRSHCAAILIDTWEKDNGGLLAKWPLRSRSQPGLADFADQVLAAGLPLVLAGSLAVKDLSILAELSPAYFAVRGAVCEGSRTDQLSEAKIRGFRNAIANIRLE